MSTLDLSARQEEVFQFSLHTVPVEVFLHICTFLDGKDIVTNLKKVCRSFYEILSDDAVWRTWLKHRWPELPTSDICYKDDVVPCQTVCLQIDRGLRLWSKKESNMKKWVQDAVHISTVDTVKLIQGGRVGISGSRDRSLAIWKTGDQLTLMDHKSNAHAGWIWALASCTKTGMLYSSSWDSTVKMWTLEQQLMKVTQFKCKAAALCVACRPGLVATGLYSPRIEIFDPRTSELVCFYTSHSRSIMDLCLVRNFIVSASEDQTISVYDITAGKTLKSGIQVSTEGHPMTLSFSAGNLLFIGDTKSKLHVLDTQNDSFSLVDTFDLGHQPGGTITSMWHNPGFVITGSKDSTVRVHTATRPPHLINQLISAPSGVIAVDFADPVLFVGCISNSVAMWTPIDI